MTATHFRQLRLRAGCTQRAWAELLGVSVGSVRNIECGTHPTIGPTLERLALLVSDAGVRTHARRVFATLNTSSVRTRLETLERQLAHYVSKPRPVPSSPSVAKRTATRRTSVILDNLRRQRALLVNGHERGWHDVPLTPEDQARLTALLADKEAPSGHTA